MDLTLSIVDLVALISRNINYGVCYRLLKVCPNSGSDKGGCQHSVPNQSYKLQSSHSHSHAESSLITQTLLGQTVGNILRRDGILPIMTPREDCPPQEEGISEDWKIFWWCGPLLLLLAPAREQEVRISSEVELMFTSPLQSRQKVQHVWTLKHFLKSQELLGVISYRAKEYWSLHEYFRLRVS